MIELTSKSANADGLILALGFFDSVHVGHRRIFAEAQAYAHHAGIQCAALTFTNNLNHFFKADPRQVYPYAERKRLLAECGIDYVLPLKFTHKLMTLDPKPFLDTLITRFSVKAFICGEDYTFGNRCAGDVAFLKSYCAQNGIGLFVVDDVMQDGKKVSSSYIKRCLSAGSIELVERLLGRPYSLTGEVVRGRGEGHLFGFPTANIRVPVDKALPKCGVYGCYAEVDGKRYRSLTNIGTKPTFNDRTFTVETMLEGFSGDLYGKTIQVGFYKFLRDTVRFPSPEALKAQIMQDFTSDFNREA